MTATTETRRRLPERLRVGKPSLAGHMPVRVGKKVYGFPQGVQVAHSTASGVRLLYVLESPGGRVHAFTEAGEVTPLSAELQATIRARVFHEETADT